MLEIKSKDQVLMAYKNRYPGLDKFVLDELSKEYDRYLEKLRGLTSREEALEVFNREIEENEQKYRDNSAMKLLEASPHTQFMEILAAYGLIVFFRDTMI